MFSLVLPQSVKSRNFTLFPGVEILQKGTVSAEFWVIRPELFGNCAFLQTFHTRKLGEIKGLYAVLQSQVRLGGSRKLCRNLYSRN